MAESKWSPPVNCRVLSRRTRGCKRASRGPCGAQKVARANIVLIVVTSTSARVECAGSLVARPGVDLERPAPRYGVPFPGQAGYRSCRTHREFKGGWFRSGRTKCSSGLRLGGGGPRSVKHPMDGAGPMHWRTFVTQSPIYRRRCVRNRICRTCRWTSTHSTPSPTGLSAASPADRTGSPPLSVMT